MVNLVIDNHAQYFIVVPGAINLVGAPPTTTACCAWGAHPLPTPPHHPQPALTLTLTPTLTRCRPRSCASGGWIPKDLVDNLDADCQARLGLGFGVRVRVRFGFGFGFGPVSGEAGCQAHRHLARAHLAPTPTSSPPT